MISQKGICEQGHNLHYKEYVFPRKHASVSHFVVIGLQICCSGFFDAIKAYWAYFRRHTPKPTEGNSETIEKFKSHVLLSFQQITLCSVHDGVYQIPSKSSSSSRKNKTWTHIKLHAHSCIIFHSSLSSKSSRSMHLFRRVEPQFMICSRRSMLNNLFLNSFPTQPAGHWNQNDFWRQLWLWSTTNKCYQATGEQRIAHHIMFFDWGPLS